MAAPLVQIVTPVTLVTPLSLVDENTEVKTRSGRPPPSYRKKRNPDASSTDDTAKLVPRKTQKQTIFRSPTTRASFSEPPPPDLDPLNGENEARSPDSMDGWLPSSRGSDTDSSDSHHRGPPISVDHEAKEAVPPEVIAQRRLELEAACVQQTGFTLYAFIVLFAITINLPFYLISVTVWDPESGYRGQAIAVGSIAFVLNFGTLTFMLTWVQKHRNQQAIRARSSLYIYTLCATMIGTMISSYLVFVFSSLDAPTEDMFAESEEDWMSVSETYQALLLASYSAWILSQTWMMTTILSRQRAVCVLFRERKPTDITHNWRIFYIPHILVIPLVLISITCAALWWYGPDNWRRRYGWAMAGQLAKTFVLMLFFFYYVWKARRLNNMYCDALQSMRAFGVDFLEFTSIAIAAAASADTWHLWMVIMYMCNGLVVTFVLDSFLGTLLSFSYPAVHKRLQGREAEVLTAVLDSIQVVEPPDKRVVNVRANSDPMLSLPRLSSTDSRPCAPVRSRSFSVDGGLRGSVKHGAYRSSMGASVLETLQEGGSGMASVTSVDTHMRKPPGEVTLSKDCIGGQL